MTTPAMVTTASWLDRTNRVAADAEMPNGTRVVTSPA